MQTTFTYDPAPGGYPGQLFDANAFLASDIVSKPAFETLDFGVLVELRSDSTLQEWRGTAPIYGVTVAHVREGVGIYSRDAVGPAYRAGDEVPVMRRGRIWMAYDSNAVAAELGRPNAWTPTTDGSGNLAKRGFLTSRATSGTVGAEIATPSGLVFFRPASASATAVVVEVGGLNAPGVDLT